MLQDKLHWLMALPNLIWASISFGKVAYSAILIGLVILLSKEFVAVWGSEKIVLGDFSYFLDGKKVEEHGNQIRSETGNFYRLILSLNEFRKTESDNSLAKDDSNEDKGTEKSVPITPIVFDSHSVIQQIDLTIQGINIKTTLSWIYKLFSHNEVEVSASIYDNSSNKRAYVSIPNELASVPADSSNADDVIKLPQTFVIDRVESDSEAAFRIASFLIWAQSVELRQRTSFDDFCDLARILVIKYFRQSKNADKETKSFKSDAEFVKRQIERSLENRIDSADAVKSLANLDAVFGDQRISLDAYVTSNVAAVSDVVLLNAITLAHHVDPVVPKVWPDPGTNKLRTKKDFDRYYFAGRFNLACKQHDVASTSVTAVRILFDIRDALGTHTVVMSGVALNPNAVLTYVPKGYPSPVIKGVPVGAKVQAIECGAVVSEVKVSKVTNLVTDIAGANFALLEVGKLSVPVPPAKFAFDGEDDDFSFSDDDPFYLHIIGYFRNMDALFQDRNERPIQELKGNDLLSIPTRIIPGIQTSAKDVGDLVVLDAPVTYGIYGGPVVDDKGRIRFFVAGSIYAGPSSYIRLARGAPIEALREKLSNFVDAN